MMKNQKPIRSAIGISEVRSVCHHGGSGGFSAEIVTPFSERRV